MAYIRTKKISGKDYAYLVEIENTSKGPRQRVKKYLGKVLVMENSAGEPNSERTEITAEKKKEFLNQMAIRELKMKGFKKNNNRLEKEGINYSVEDLSLRKGKKDVLLKLNEGYLSGHTLCEILNFKKSKDVNKDAVRLAKSFLNAGLLVSREEFVRYYQMER
jgi:hypothetical protein